MFVDKEYILKSLELYQAERAPNGWNDAMQRAIEVVEDAPGIKAEKFGTFAKVVPGVLKDEPEKVTADLLKDFAVSMYAVGAITINSEYEPSTNMMRIAIQTLPMVRGEGK